MQRPREEGFEDKGSVSRTRVAGDQVTEDRESTESCHEGPRARGCNLRGCAGWGLRSSHCRAEETSPRRVSGT